MVQLGIHLTHSRRRLVIESRANYVIMLRYKSFIIYHNNGVRTGELSRRIDNGNIYRHLLRNAAPAGHKIGLRKFTHILSFCFVQSWDSSAYKFSQFVHKIRHVVIEAYYRSLAQHTTSSDL